MNRQAMIARCEIRFRDSGGDILGPDDWAEYLNDVYMDAVSARQDWPFLESRSTSLVVPNTGDGEIALPPDGWRVTAVYNKTDEYPLQQIDGRSDYRFWFPDPEDNRGTPTHYRLRKNIIEVYPFPAAETTLHVDVYLPPAPLGITDEPVFPEQYHRMLVSGALAYAYEDDGNAEQAALHQARFDRLLANMVIDLISPRTDQYPGVIDNFF